MDTTMVQTPTTNTRLTSKWVMAAGVVGLVAAGAMAGVLINRHSDSQASTAPTNGAANTPAGTKAAGSTHAKAATGTTGQASGRQTPQVASAQICANCGVVESVQVEKQKGEATGVGAIAGGLIGGIVGNQVGGGSGRSVMTVAGAVGGGVVGNEIEKNQRATTVFVAQVRMDDGSLRTFRQSAPIAQGQRVKVDGQQLRIAESQSKNG